MAQIAAGANPVLSPVEVRSVITGLMLAILLGAIDQTIVSVALPKISAQLGGVDLLSWVVSGYLVTAAVATPIYGKLGDLYGRRAMLSIAIAIFLATSIACALAQSMPMLVGARILQGLGGGGLISVAQAIIADVVSPRERGRYQGYISGAYAVASVSGPILGGLLTQYLSWRWIFWINVPLSLAALFISRQALAGLPVLHVKRPIDILGAILLCAGLAALLVSITRIGQGVSWLAADNLQLFGLAIVFLAVFIRHEGRAPEPIIPLELFRDRTVAISCMVLFFSFFQLMSLTVLMPLRLQMVIGAGVDRAAFQLVPLTLAVPCGAYMSGRMMAHFGLGAQMPASMVAVQSAVPARHLGIATATTSFFRSLGAAIGIAILTALLLATLREILPALAASGSGAEFIKDMVGDTLAKMDTVSRAQLATAVEQSFRKIFIISGTVALLPLALVTLITDRSLDAHS